MGPCIDCHQKCYNGRIHELHVQWFNDSVMSLADHARGGPGGSSGGRFGQCFGQDSGLVDCQGLTLHNEAHLLEV